MAMAPGSRQTSDYSSIHDKFPGQPPASICYPFCPSRSDRHNSMFAVQCSFCQHENIPGARFCAECGSPLHLRVCPNSNCGKVSDVNARQCEHCGTFFPEIPLADAALPTKAAPAAAPSPPVTETKQGVSALPLIIVAIVAGGLPLLWFNRSHLPAPKNWQPEPVGSASLPAQPIPITVLPSAPQPAPAAVLPPLQVAPPAEPDVEKAVPDRSTAEKAALEAEAQAKIEREKAAKAKAAREAKERKAREATAATEAQRPCTEAIAAVGLCDPKQIKK
jgi:hypothetical protein